MLIETRTVRFPFIGFTKGSRSVLGSGLEGIHVTL